MSNETVTPKKLVLTIEEFDRGLSFRAEGHIGKRAVPAMVSMLEEFCYNMVGAYVRDDGGMEISVTNVPKASNLH